jgi:hypothetical protein
MKKRLRSADEEENCINGNPHRSATEKRIPFDVEELEIFG